ncbi:MAG: hypothetical protein ACD_19C00182G0060 [uncultured bacterium]|nr:MAG: hypothetical protein ACD_19C00182G0060 [uncultured bacterium]
MGILPEREPRKNSYENPDEVSALNIERKEVVTPVPTQFKAQVTDNQGNPIISTPETIKADIIIPEVNKETLEVKIKGDTEESSVWSAGYWLRILKKAIYFGWKVVFGK